uniref:Peroxisomal ATPase PEX1 n=1 Tax=Peronospora matthiolae TaxID=2874970 RepID=A0AAV1U7Q2_9STRA
MTMAARGTFLQPVLVPINSCYVNLPLTFVQTFLGGTKLVRDGSTILELSWDTIDGDVQRVCVGWIGGIVKTRALLSNVIEVPIKFARWLGIQDHLEKMPQSLVGVHVVEAVPIARQMSVEPCTPDDWELIQLHAGKIETELLRQMCVVNDKQVIPIWVSQNALICIRASLPDGIEYARLTPASEVIVAPKERRSPTTSNGLSPDLYYEPSPPLVIQGDLGTLQNNTSDEVWVHPESLAALDGAIVPGTSSDAQEAPIVTLWSSASKPTTENNSLTETVREQRNCCVARLKAACCVVRGHVLPSRSVLATLGIGTHKSIYLRVLKHSALPPSSVLLLTNLEGLDDGALACQVQQSFLHWSSLTEQSHVVSSGRILCLELEPEKFVQVIADVQYDTDEVFSAEQQQDVPVGALEKYTVLGGSKGGHILSLGQVTVQSAVGIQKRVLTELHAEGSSTRTFNLAILELLRKAKPYAALMKAVRPVLSQDASAARVVLGTKPPGSALVCGDRGSGKSTLLRALAHEVRTSFEYAAFATTVDCRDLRGLKMEIVKLRLSALFEEAAAHAPALIALDNLDALVPEEDESAGAANEQSRRIAEMLLDLMRQNSQRMHKAAVGLRASFKRECEVIEGCPEIQKRSARIKLLAVVGNAMQSQSVAVVAASRSDMSVHKIIRGCGLFDRSIQVTAPDTERRETLIQEMLEMKVKDVNLTANGSEESRRLVIDPAIDFGHLSSLMEGYSLRDMSSATDRALHRTFHRHALAQSSRDCRVPLNVEQRDFEEGIVDFQPTGLIGVDLSRAPSHGQLLEDFNTYEQC